MRKLNTMLGMAMTGGLAVAGLVLTAPSAEAAADPVLTAPAAEAGVAPPGCVLGRPSSTSVQATCYPGSTNVRRYRAVAYCQHSDGRREQKYGPTVTTGPGVISLATCSAGFRVYDDAMQYS